MLNKAVLIGRLTKDPENRSTQSGVSVATFTLAVDRNYASKNGEKDTDFIPIVAWRELADLCSRFLEKGRLVAVTGRIQTRSYEGNDGTRRYVTEIVADEVNFLERSKQERQAQQPATPQEQGGFTPVDPGEDDELPF